MATRIAFVVAAQSVSVRREGIARDAAASHYHIGPSSKGVGVEPGAKVPRVRIEFGCLTFMK